jgi:hypothetical protein
MNEWERVRALWVRQQRGESPSEDATPTEQHYYKLIEQLESADQKSKEITVVQSSNRYRFRLQAS